jgi:heme exporter protein CcmD
VNGSVQQSAEKTVVTANSIAALNIRDHSGYVMAAYGIALVTLLLNLLGALRSGREARQGIARRLRQESNS